MGRIDLLAIYNEIYYTGRDRKNFSILALLATQGHRCAFQNRL
jgi:hypothetical protein